jgi:hypothetical protein
MTRHRAKRFANNPAIRDALLLVPEPNNLANEEIPDSAPTTFEVSSLDHLNAGNSEGFGGANLTLTDNSTATPEPASMALMAMGVALFSEESTIVHVPHEGDVTFRRHPRISHGTRRRRIRPAEACSLGAAGP